MAAQERSLKIGCLWLVYIILCIVMVGGMLAMGVGGARTNPGFPWPFLLYTILTFPAVPLMDRLEAHPSGIVVPFMWLLNSLFWSVGLYVMLSIAQRVRARWVARSSSPSSSP